MKYAILVLVLMAGNLYAQDAKVIQLSPEDSAKVAAKYQALQIAQKEWNEVQTDIQTKYTATKNKNESTFMFDNGQRYKTGWESGIEFDASFKFIVPKPSTVTYTGCQYNLTGCPVLMPAN